MDAPQGSNITINPDALDITIAGDTTFNYSVIVTDEDGNPLNNVEVFISGPFAFPRDPARYQFFRERGGANAVNSGFTGVTDQNGVYEFSIIVFAGTAFDDQISVQSGSSFASSDISAGI